MSEKEKQRLNQLGQSILREKGIDLESNEDYDWIRTKNIAGYAHYYLRKCWNESEMINDADVSIHNQLVSIDFKLGTSASLQLLACTGAEAIARSDIIKVEIFKL